VDWGRGMGEGYRWYGHRGVGFSSLSLLQEVSAHSEKPRQCLEPLANTRTPARVLVVLPADDGAAAS
jgi:hypothetical protein